MQGEGLKKLQSGQPISTREQLLLIAQLSWPAILAQISSVVMQYIDTAMVGQLGSNASAAIGVVATTSWLFGDLCIALTIGFNVAVAQALGARQSEKARGIMKLAFLVCMAFSLVMMAIALGITGNLPRWLRADPAIWQDASAYFLVFVLSLPFMQMNNLCGGLLRSAGNMKTPGICMVVMCLLDVVFNAFLIFPGGTLRVLGVTLPGFGLGVLGASMGTALSQVVIAVVLTYILLVRSPELHLRRGEKARFTAEALPVYLGSRHGGAHHSFHRPDGDYRHRGPAGHHRHGGQLLRHNGGESLLYVRLWRAGGGLHAGGPERRRRAEGSDLSAGLADGCAGHGLDGDHGDAAVCAGPGHDRHDGGGRGRH